MNHLWHTDRTVTKLLTVWLIGDGKPGHENQSLGLADALARRVACEVHQISLAGARGIVGRIKTAVRTSDGLPRPDLIIAAGHATHFALLWLARKHRAKSIVLMKPSLPMGCFDLCIVPAHDFAGGCPRENVIVTRGALNRVLPPQVDSRDGRMILIGGPSSTHGWDGDALLSALGKITSNGNWQLSDSRRTPDGFMSAVKTRLPEIEIFPHQQTGPEWLPARLAAAGEIWVTEDSVSMIYEALSSGARVGVLPVPRLQADARVIRGLAGLITDHFLTTLAEWENSGELKPPSATLREADRCAELVLSRLEIEKNGIVKH